MQYINNINFIFPNSIQYELNRIYDSWQIYTIILSIIICIIWPTYRKKVIQLYVEFYTNLYLNIHHQIMYLALMSYFADSLIQHISQVIFIPLQISMILYVPYKIYCILKKLRNKFLVYIYSEDIQNFINQNLSKEEQSKIHEIKVKFTHPFCSKETKIEVKIIFRN